MFTLADKNDMISDEIGICSIAAYLRKNNYDVSLYALKEGYNSEEVLDEVRDINPEVMLFSVYSDRIEVAKRQIKKLKKMCPSSFIAVGGYVATYYDEILNEIPQIDVLVRGEGEITTYELLECVRKGKSYHDLQGISFMSNGIFIKNPDREFIFDIDKIPWMARDYIKKYNIAIVAMSTSRGCSHACSFCSSPLFWSQNGCNWRGRSVDSIISELKYLKNKFNISNINFYDNSFEDPTVDRMEELVDRIIYEKLDISYTINCRVRSVIEFSNELITKLIESGMKSMFLGVESANVDDLLLYNKNITLEQIEYAITRLSKFNINVEIGFINFNPYSTIDNLRQNMEFLHRYNYTTYMINYKGLRLYRGCALYNKIKRDGLLKKDNKNVFVEEYNFVDERIGKLYSAIKTFLENETAKQMFVQLQYYSIYFKEEVVGEINDNNKDMLREILVKNEEVLKEFSNVNYRIFMELLDMTELGCDMIYFSSKLNQLINDDVKRMLKKLSSNKMRFRYLIAKHKRKG